MTDEKDDLVDSTVGAADALTIMMKDKLIQDKRGENSSWER